MLRFTGVKLWVSVFIGFFGQIIVTDSGFGVQGIPEFSAK